MTIYNDMRTNLNYQISLVMNDVTNGSGKSSTNRIVKAVLQNDIAISGGNDFTTAGDIIADIPVIGTLKNTKDRASALVKAFGRSTTTAFETTLAWSNSVKPLITVEMTFYQEKAGVNDILSDYLRIKSATLPSTVGSFFKAPLGYRIVGDVARLTKAVAQGKLPDVINAEGLVSIKIGKWLHMTGMVIKDESFTISKEVNSLGKPLFITGSITLEPHTALTYEKFKSYFINTSVTDRSNG